MAFVQKTWTDRVAEFINRRILTKEDGTTELVTVARSEGTVSVEGDGFTAKNMNDLEQRVADEFASLNGNLANGSVSFSVGEDGHPYITYEVGADTVTKKLGSGIDGVKYVNVRTATASSSGSSLFAFYTDNLYANGITRTQRYHSSGADYTDFGLVSIGYGSVTGLYWSVKANVDVEYHDVANDTYGTLQTGETLEWRYTETRDIVFIEQ